ncbi:hypothetical protein ACIQM4_25055 [Streptomyces sp. NPDC091272]|uniref:hypothetical protein n=1 Tax=Streptomyces sp. NPDC091272 TaxID=3365981 RepID=UPI0038270C25
MWDEWDRLKEEVAERRSAQGAAGAGTEMRLNSLPGKPPGGGPGGGPGGRGQGDLKVTQQDLAHIGDFAFKLFQRLAKEGRGPVAGTATAAGDLSGQGFALGGALHQVQERWGQQVRSLVDACAHISNHLDFTQKAHRGDEHFVSRTVSGIKELSAAFDEESERRR